MQREVKEETNLNVILPNVDRDTFPNDHSDSNTNISGAIMGQFRVYSNPERDERRHTVSVIHRVLIKDTTLMHNGDDAKSCNIILLNGSSSSGQGHDLLALKDKLAFDHYNILHDYIQHYHPEKGLVSI